MRRNDQCRAHRRPVRRARQLRDAEQPPARHCQDPERSGVHLHDGAAGEVTKYFLGLRVTLNADERSGIYFRDVTVRPISGHGCSRRTMYIDEHTVKYALARSATDGVL